MKIGQKFERIDKTKESSTLKAEKQCDRELLDVLTSEDNGMFKAGLLPQVACSTSAGSKAVLDIVGQAIGWEILGSETNLGFGWC